MGRKAYAQGISYKSFYSWYGSMLDRLQSDGSNIPEHFLQLSAQVETWKHFWPNEVFLANIPTGKPRETPTDPEAQSQTTALHEKPPPSAGHNLAEDAPIYSDNIEQNTSQEVIPPGPLKFLPTEQSPQTPIVSLPSTYQPSAAPLHNTTPSGNKLVTKTTPLLDGRDDDANNDIKDAPHGVADAKESPFLHKPCANNEGHIGIAAQQERRDFCANCHAEDHLLQACMGPVDNFGFISGCPRCNTMTHLFEHCPNQKKNESTSYLHYLVTARHNRPPIRWTQDIRGIPKFWNQSRRPWTCEYSLKEAIKPEGSCISSGRPKRNIDYDPAWNNPDKIPSQAYPKQEVQNMRELVESKLEKLVDEGILEQARKTDHLHRLERFRRLLEEGSPLLSQKLEEVLNSSSQISSLMLENRSGILTLARSLDYIADLEWKQARGECLLLQEIETLVTKRMRLIDLEVRIDHYLGELHASYDNEMQLKQRIRRLLSEVQWLASFESRRQNGATLNHVIFEKIATLQEKEKYLKVLFGAYRRRFSLPPEPLLIPLKWKTTSCTDFRDFSYSSFDALHYIPPSVSPPPKPRRNPETMSSPTMDLVNTADQNSNILNRDLDNEYMYRVYEQNYGRSLSPHDRQDSLASAEDLSIVPLDTNNSSSDSNRPMELTGSVQYKVALSKKQKTLKKEISGLQRQIKEIEGLEKRTGTLTTKQLQRIAKKGEKKARLASLRRHQQSNDPESQTVQMIQNLEKSHSSRFTQAEEKTGPVNNLGSGVAQSSVSTSSSIDSLPPLPSQLNNVQTRFVESKPRVSAHSYAGKAAHIPPTPKPLRKEYRRDKEVSSKQEEWPSTSSQARAPSTPVTKEAKTISYAEKLRQMSPKTPSKQQSHETNIVPKAQGESPSRSSEAKELNSDVAKEAPTISQPEKFGKIAHKPENSPAQQVLDAPSISNLQEWPTMSSQTEVSASNVNNWAPETSYAEMVAQEPPDPEALEERPGDSGSSSVQEEWPSISSQTEVLSSDVIDQTSEISKAEKNVQESISPKLESSKEPTVIKTPAPFPILSAMETQATAITNLKSSKKPTIAKIQDPFPIVVAMETQSVASDESESTSYADITSGLKKTTQDVKASLKVLKSKLPPPVYEIQEDSSSLNELQSSPVTKNESTSASNRTSKVSSSKNVFQEAGAPSSVARQSTSSIYVPPQRRRIPSSCSLKSSSSLQSGNTNVYIPPRRRRLSSTSDVEFILPSNSISLNKRRLSLGSMGAFSYNCKTHKPPSAGFPKSRPNHLNTESPKLSVVIEGNQEGSNRSISPELQDTNSKERTSPLQNPALNNNQLLFPPTEFPEGSTRRSSSTPPGLDAGDMDLRKNISRASSPGSTNLQLKRTRTLRRPEKRRALSSGSPISTQTSSLLVPAIAVPQRDIARNYKASSKASSRILSETDSSVGSASDTDSPFELPLPDDFDISFELEHPDEFDTSLHHPNLDDFLLSDGEDDVKKCRVLNSPDSFDLGILSDGSPDQDAINANADANADADADTNANANTIIPNNTPNIPEAQPSRISWANESEIIICWQCNGVGHVTYECPERVFNPLIQESNNSTPTTTSEHNTNQAIGIQDTSTLDQDTALNTSPPTTPTETKQTKEEEEEEDKTPLERNHPSPTHPPGAMRDDGSIVPFVAGDWKCGWKRCHYWNFAANSCCLRCGDRAAFILRPGVAGAGVGLDIDAGADTSAADSSDAAHGTI
ncbi:hypothetical protein SS1G_07220 [Sclerotinia sclerotiorum 1980 UF-70]|uniref:CCHC-type domain-containing protein n=1 Tax=Sclerotinia sclerotiorum (strain ATCC 18683 / 1980 / Ss-1) TaxID=665079 RepID=A7EPH1_SCLS1|nr:hypothetical protein SS1G_07220 [Sclerotinia sclerotiorum 1980 UF-70]EDO04737.1 hypothetical protein SS1G_07220 [Sclerotinia sclerotiorum 1980 UF-70]